MVSAGTRGGVGLALLAAVTLDGGPENLFALRSTVGRAEAVQVPLWSGMLSPWIG